MSVGGLGDSAAPLQGESPLHQRDVSHAQLVSSKLTHEAHTGLFSQRVACNECARKPESGDKIDCQISRSLRSIRCTVIQGISIPPEHSSLFMDHPSVPIERVQQVFSVLERSELSFLGIRLHKTL